MAQLLEQGTHLGPEDKYRITELLGQGGMGAVYDAIHVELHRRVAIKVLHPHIAQDKTLLERFRREAIAAAELGHPHIIAVSDLHIDPDGLSFMVMERLEGRSLDAVIGDGPLSPDRVAFIGSQLLSALDAAHGAGIIHRDLKPENVFLTAIAGVPDVVKLLDFGIAKLVDTGDEGHLTGTGMILGTPIFMAPEQALGEGVTAATDIYSLGGILFNALTGRPPRSGKSFGAIFHSILSEPVAPVRSLRPDLDPDFAAVIDRAMTQSADDRFSSAQEMAQALAPFTPSGQTAPGYRAASASASSDGEEGLPATKLSTNETDPLAETAATPPSLKKPKPSPYAKTATPASLEKPDTFPYAETAVTPPSLEKPADAPQNGRSSSASPSESAAPPRPAKPPWLWLLLGAGAAALIAFAVIGVRSLLDAPSEPADEPSATRAELSQPRDPSPPMSSKREPRDAGALSDSDRGATSPAPSDGGSEAGLEGDADIAVATDEESPRDRHHQVKHHQSAKRTQREAPPQRTKARAEPSVGRRVAPDIYLSTVNCRSGFLPRSLSPVRNAIVPTLGAVRRCYASARIPEGARLNRCVNLSLDSSGQTRSTTSVGTDPLPSLDRCLEAALRNVRIPSEVIDEPTAAVQVCYRPRGM